MLLSGFLLLTCFVSGAAPTALDQGFTAMYNLDFAAAHRDFAAWEKAHPQDPMGPVSDAAAVLFSEFARMHILEAEFFTDDSNFKSGSERPAVNPATKREFDTDLSLAQQYVQAQLAHHPDDANAQLADVMGRGLHADYLALIDKRNLAALTEIKTARDLAAQLLAKHPDCHDANIAAGIENYLLSQKSAPLRWMLRMGGAQTDKQEGLAQLRITADQGHYLLPYARLLLAVADLRDDNRPAAVQTLTWLAHTYQGNPLYQQELTKLTK